MVKTQKEIFLFAGTNGSGKSAIVRLFLKQKICPQYYICLDNNIDKSLKNDITVYIKAMGKAKEQRLKAVQNERSFSF
jgi:predicted ABC-type ATPase